MIKRGRLTVCFLPGLIIMLISFVLCVEGHDVVEGNACLQVEPVSCYSHLLSLRTCFCGGGWDALAWESTGYFFYFLVLLILLSGLCLRSFFFFSIMLTMDSKSLICLVPLNLLVNIKKSKS